MERNIRVLKENFKQDDFRMTIYATIIEPF